ncbi:MAG: hypothetical protein D6780_08215 [Candidatus Dadabacteria bacterium]|nr:MAG: hypothetical protein D6780_08215 [Candidatus Dadabacteria bacterium]
MRAVKEIFFLSLILFANAAYAKFVEVRGNLEELRRGGSKAPSVIYLSFPLGNGSGRAIFKLYRKKSFSSTPFIVKGRFQGRNKGGKNSPYKVHLVGGAIVTKHTFRLNFISPRAQPMELRVNLSKPEIGWLRHRSRFTKLNCGNSVAEELSNDSVSFLSFLRLSPASLRYIEVATDTDCEYTSQLGGASEALANIESVINTADAVYQSQLGLSFDVRAQGTFTDCSSQPYQKSVSDELLIEFGNYINSTGRLGSFDVAHLFTGKDLEGGVVGLAWTGAICVEPTLSYSLTQHVSSVLDWILFAHEIGHNLGASHDYNPLTGTGSQYIGHIMNAVVSAGNTTFSSLSISEITSFVESNGSCLDTTVNSTPPATPSSSVVSFSLLNISSSIGKKSATFSATLDQLVNQSSCTVQLFGATKKKFIQNASGDLNSAKKVVVLTNKEAISLEASVSLGAKVKNCSGSKKKKVFFVAQLECGGEIIGRSEIKKKKVVACGRRNKTKKFLKRLAKKLKAL